MDTILTRRSIRKYTNDIVSEEDIAEIVKAGMNAPSARNVKSAEFIVINDRKILDKIVCKNKHASMLKEATAAIAVCSKEVTEFWVQDLAAATQNMLLKTTDLGLGACWIGIYPIEQKERDMHEILNVPEDIRVLSLISLGYPNEVKEPNSCFDYNRIHINKW